VCIVDYSVLYLHSADVDVIRRHVLDQDQPYGLADCTSVPAATGFVAAFDPHQSASFYLMAKSRQPQME